MRTLGMLFGVAMMALPSSQAAALSCLAPDFRRDWWTHVDAPDTYVLALGRFSALRDSRHDTAQDLVVWQATFTGMTASARAFDQPFMAEVKITDHLFTHIDGGGNAPEALAQGLPGLEGLVFLRRVPGGLALETALCVPVIDTDAANVRPALDCLNGRRCPRPD